MKKQIVGWREWIALPELGVDWLKAKVDTGARTSAINAVDVEIEESPSGHEIVAFTIHPYQGSEAEVVRATCTVVDHREVKSSTGDVTVRPVIKTPVTVGGRTYRVELTLVDRSDMGFRMLLGREALRPRLVVDPGRSYLGGRPPRAIRAANRGR